MWAPPLALPSLEGGHVRAAFHDCSLAIAFCSSANLVQNIITLAAHLMRGTTQCYYLLEQSRCIFVWCFDMIQIMSFYLCGVMVLWIVCAFWNLCLLLRLIWFTFYYFWNFLGLWPTASQLLGQKKERCATSRSSREKYSVFRQKQLHYQLNCPCCRFVIGIYFDLNSCALIYIRWFKSGY
jgi:hypothetical protein